MSTAVTPNDGVTTGGNPTANVEMPAPPEVNNVDANKARAEELKSQANEYFKSKFFGDL